MKRKDVLEQYDVKDYIAIARAINGTRYVENPAILGEESFAGINAACAEIADVLAGTLAADNPRFDRARFLTACGIEG